MPAINRRSFLRALGSSAAALPLSCGGSGDPASSAPGRMEVLAEDVGG